MNRCKAKTRNGDQCKNNAIFGTDYCYLKSHCKGNNNLIKRGLNLLLNKWPLAVILFLITLLLTFNQSKIEAVSGILMTRHNANKKTVAIGGIKIIMETENNTVVYDDGDPVLIIQLIDNKLYISSIIRNFEGEIVAEIYKNEWKLNRGKYYERNYNNNAVEVRDHSGRIILQVVNFGDLIHFAGVFHTKKGNVVSFVPLEDLTAAIEIKPSINDLELSITPIFDYPHEGHFGDCPRIIELEKIINAGSSTFHFSDGIDIGKYSNRLGIIRLV